MKHTPITALNVGLDFNNSILPIGRLAFKEEDT